MPRLHLDLVVTALGVLAVLILLYVGASIARDTLDASPAARVAGLDEHGYPLALGVDPEVTTDLTGFITTTAAPRRGGRHRPENVCAVDATYRPLHNPRFTAYITARTREGDR